MDYASIHSVDSSEVETAEIKKHTNLNLNVGPSQTRPYDDVHIRIVVKSFQNSRKVAEVAGIIC